MKQLFKLSELEGKTIKASVSDESEDKLVLVLEDDSFIYFYGIGGTIYCDDEFDADDFELEEVFKLGIVTEAEYQKEMQKLEDARIEHERKQKEARRKLYEELKEEFDAVTTGDN